MYARETANGYIRPLLSPRRYIGAGGNGAAAPCGHSFGEVTIFPFRGIDFWGSYFLCQKSSPKSIASSNGSFFSGKYSGFSMNLICF